MSQPNPRKSVWPTLLRAEAQEPAQDMVDRLSVAARSLGYEVTLTDPNTVRIARATTNNWLRWPLTSLYRRRHTIILTLRHHEVLAKGYGSIQIVAFLGAYLLGVDAPALSQELRELAEGP